MNVHLCMIRALLVLFIVTVGATIACGPFYGDGGSCPDYDLSDAIPLQDGTYAYLAGSEDIYRHDTPQPGPAIEDFPHAGLEHTEVDFDRDADRVIVRYERDGQQVVETWRVASYEVREF